jgi:hypothetical protein
MIKSPAGGKQKNMPRAENLTKAEISGRAEIMA